MSSWRPPSAASLRSEAILGRSMGSSRPLFGLQTKWRAIRLHSLALSTIAGFSGVSSTAVVLSPMYPSQEGGGRLEARGFRRVYFCPNGLLVVLCRGGVMGGL